MRNYELVIKKNEINHVQHIKGPGSMIGEILDKYRYHLITFIIKYRKQKNIHPNILDTLDICYRPR